MLDTPLLCVASERSPDGCCEECTCSSRERAPPLVPPTDQFVLALDGGTHHPLTAPLDLPVQSFVIPVKGPAKVPLREGQVIMSFKYLHGCAVAAVLLLGACGGGGDDPPNDAGGGTGTVPAPAPPTPPTPGPVVANAGPDLATVEKQSVLVDGSGTRDAENDPITYAWQLVSSPAGSAAQVTATTATFEFTPDLPGTYELRLTASDPQGNTTDSTQVVADPLLAFAAASSFNIDPASVPGSDRGELTLRASPHYRGEPIAITPSSSVPWLRVSPPAGGAAVAAGQAATLPLQLDLQEIARLPNGQYTARITVPPPGGRAAATVDVPLSFVLPHVRTVVPYVAYAGQASRVTLYGDNLSAANGRTLVINGVEVPGVSALDDKQATVELPALPAGKYTVRVKNGLGIVQDMGWVVVRDAPVYANADVALPGLVEAIEFDAERDAFYGVFRDGTEVVAYRFRLIDGAWQAERIDVAGPGAARLTVDGRELLVTSGNCTIVHLDPETLGRLRATTKPSCVPSEERLSDVLPLADARVFAADEDEESSVWTYPEFKAADILPTADRPFALMSYERNRLFWAERPEGQPNWKAYTYSVTSPTARAFAPHGALGFEITNLAISGNGRRALHRSDVYDEEFRYTGTLGGVGDPTEIVPGLNRDGTRSVVLDATVNAIVVNDLTGPGPVYPVIGAPIQLPSDTQDDSVMIVSPNGSAAFAFTSSRLFVFTAYVLYVRQLP